MAETVEPMIVTADQLQADADPRGESDPGSDQAGPPDPGPVVIDPGDERIAPPTDPGAAQTEQLAPQAEPEDPLRRSRGTR